MSKVASDGKKFKKAERGDSYWSYFETLCKRQKLLDHEAVLVLASRIADHPNGPLWYETSIEPVETTIKLSEVKDLFYQQFLSSQWKTDRFHELMDTCYRANETVHEFTDRFAAKVRDNEIPWSNEEGNSHSEFVMHILFYKCPPSVQRMLGDKKVEMFKSPKALADVLNQFPGYPDDVPDREFNCPNCPKKISWSLLSNLK